MKLTRMLRVGTVLLWVCLMSACIDDPSDARPGDQVVNDTGTKEPDGSVADSSVDVPSGCAPACESPEVCGAAGDPNACACPSDELVCEALGLTCGAAEVEGLCSNKSGVDCGGCVGVGEECVDNKCQCPAEDDAALCARANAECGGISFPDRCGVLRIVASCGECSGMGETCGGDNRCACVPESDVAFCNRLSAACGRVSAPDNCGSVRTVASCGTCAALSEACTPENTCECTSRSDAEFCAANGADCGMVSATDVCGASRSVDCGGCAGTEICQASQCVCVPEDNPSFCARLGATCGSLGGIDNCGGQRTVPSCGVCSGAGETCTSTNQCSCTPESAAAFCARSSAECGSLTATDNCGQTRTETCGACTGTGESCVSNVCACAAETDAAFCTAYGAECGPVNGIDSCGAGRFGVDCGTCQGTGEVCTNGLCICAPETDAELCARFGATCGPLTETDNCGQGRTIASCGTCSGTGESCMAGVCTCPPETDSEFCARFGAACGSIDGVDTCGQARFNVDCGACAGAGEICQPDNTCLCTPVTDAELCQTAGAECGALSVSDNCGASRSVPSCGACPATHTCDGSNQCSCTPESDAAFCARIGATCGSTSEYDNCGEPRFDVDCGQCAWSLVGVGNSTYAGVVPWTPIGFVPPGASALAFAVWAGETEDFDVVGDQGNYTISFDVPGATCTSSDAPWGVTVEAECVWVSDLSTSFLFNNNYPTQIIVECSLRYDPATRLIEFEDNDSTEDCAYAVYALF